MLVYKKIATIQWFILSFKKLNFYRNSEAIGSREKVSNLDKSSLKPSLYNKAINNVVEYTSTSSTMSESKSEIISKKKTIQIMVVVLTLQRIVVQIQQKKMIVIV